MQARSYAGRARRQFAINSPPFVLNVWVNKNPSQLTGGDLGYMLGQGFELDTANPGTMYWCNGPINDVGNQGGLYKSTNNASTWRRVGNVSGGYITNPLHVRIDPNNSNHLYLVSGVRGTYIGFWISTDGGETFTQPAGIATAASAAGAGGTNDAYSLSVNPTDFNDVLFSMHSPAGGAYGTDAVAMRSTDGGTTWSVITLPSGAGAGQAIHFLYDPPNSQGNASTLLLGCQFGAGTYRSTNGGTSWTKVSNADIAHGGQQIYYTPAGVLHIAGYLITQKSSDNGATWSTTYNNPSWAIHGAVIGGTQQLWTGPNDVFADQLQVSTDGGTTFADLNATLFNTGPFCMRFDAINKILWCSFWNDGVWAIRLE